MLSKAKQPWQARRAALNHDQLKNRFLPALAKWLNVLDGQVEDIDFEQAFVSTVLPAWEGIRCEARALAASFEKEMSPKSCLESKPLCRVDPPTRAWLGMVLHACWLTRLQINSLLDQLVSCIADVDETYAHLRQVIGDLGGTPSNLKCHREEFASLRNACVLLAKAIERMPSQIRV